MSSQSESSSSPSPQSALPTFLRGTVIKGFGRGSKELGIPTANLPEDIANSMSEGISTGIYYGWASVTQSKASGSGSSSTPAPAAPAAAPVYPMVMSVGWNPFYKNEKRSAEVHIIHDFAQDFYGDELAVVVTGYIRPELSFTTLDALIAAIHADIEKAKKDLELPEHAQYKTSAWLQGGPAQSVAAAAAP
ncbi:riboflavin kinase [Capsaspora owczarzaki ATCC 30864]|uniref:riboflavin kinase n=1 Tax=Capsaspora owczarzaki (strain ATCC 30864) TaxID=595528 RepID=A0A0D2WHS8_CAPO3|nr:riboflavin kinase [Capsaspora owczarzaki ATCC 30864]KJE88368.1 riboflavin kinase [Capsaspora owczarzaki ATCC 30864]|eukprot:XP_004364900.1 riboflavin kinase [Capsaspora owczarzaki ATCC 30864]